MKRYKRIKTADITSDFVIISESRLLHFFINELEHPTQTKYIKINDRYNFISTFKNVAVLYSENGSPERARELAELPNTSKFIEHLNTIYNNLDTYAAKLHFLNFFTSLFYSELLQCLKLDYSEELKTI